MNVKKVFAAMLTAAMAAGMMSFAAFAASETGCDGGDSCIHVASITRDAAVIHYDAIQEAVDAAQAEETVTVLRDTTEKVTVSAGSVTLDLNGKTIACNETSKSDFIGAINVTGGSLRIVDSSNEKSGTVKGDMFAVLVKDGNLIIEDGIYDCVDNAVNWYEPLFIGKGYATLKGGTFCGEVEYFAYYGDGVGALTIEGGRFEDYPIGVTPNKGFSILVPNNEDGFFDAYLTYADFAAANSGAFSYDAAENKLKMVSDYTVKNIGIWFNQDVALDLNGRVLQFAGFLTSGHTSLIVNNKNVTLDIQDSATGGMIKTSCQTVIDTLGTVNLHSGLLQTTAIGTAVVVSEGGAFYMDGGEVSSMQVGVGNTKSSVTKNMTSSIEITGGKITANPCVSINSASYRYQPVTTNCVIGGTAELESGNNGTAVNMSCTDQPNSKVTINGGSINGAVTKSSAAPEGAVVITGGTFQTDVREFVPGDVAVTPNEDGSFTVGGTVIPAGISASDVDAALTADGTTATIRFITKVDAAGEQPTAFYTWILPQFVFGKVTENIPYAVVKYTDTVEAGKTFAADLENIPYEYFDEPIMAWSHMENGTEKASCDFAAGSVNEIVGSKQN